MTITEPNQLTDQHLGDGVYASFDGYHVVLDLRAQDDTTRICLEPQVLRNLIYYAQRHGALPKENHHAG